MYIINNLSHIYIYIYIIGGSGISDLNSNSALCTNALEKGLNPSHLSPLGRRDE